MAGRLPLLSLGKVAAALQGTIPLAPWAKVHSTAVAWRSRRDTGASLAGFKRPEPGGRDALNSSGSIWEHNVQPAL